jgi:hypothetical protein
MEYRGVKYTVVQGSQPDVWRWSVLVGNPEMLRLGDETTEQKAVMEVRRAIDRALAIDKGPTRTARLTGTAAMTMPGGCTPHGAGLGAIRVLTFWQERFPVSCLNSQCCVGVEMP